MLNSEIISLHCKGNHKKYLIPLALFMTTSMKTQTKVCSTSDLYVSKVTTDTWVVF